MEDVVSVSQEIRKELIENISPKKVYSVFDCKIDESKVTIDSLTVTSADLAKHLEDCRRVVLIAATLGAKADLIIRKYCVQDMQKAVVAQEVCAVMIEDFLDEAEKELLQKNDLKGLFPVKRYSPGYGDFDITCQKDILNMLNASRIGLSLTDGFMLTPSKSVTAVIGFSQEHKNAKAKCECCAKENCCYREAV